MDDRVNIILNPNCILNEFEDPVVILKAGFYKNVSNHKINRGLKNIKSRDIFLNENVKFENAIDEAILIYCIKGEGYLISASSKYLIRKGCIAFCDKKAVHAYETNPNNPWTIYWFHFTGCFSDYFAKMINSSNDCTMLEINESDHLIQMMNKVINLLNTNPDFIKTTTSNSYLKACLCEILMNYNKISYYSDPFHDAIEKSIQYMYSRVDYCINLNEICKQINISKYYFSRKFKIVTGFSPIDYYNQLKIQKACSMLDSNKCNIQEVSISLGYSTPYYFSKSFKKITGFSPKEYRNLKRNKF